MRVLASRPMITLLGVCLAAAIGVAQAQEALFRLDGLDYGREDLPASVQQGLFDADLQRYQAQRRLAEDGAVEIYLQTQSERSGKPVDALREDLLAVGQPSDQEIEAFYNANRQRIPYGLDQVRDQISGLLRERALLARKSALVEELEVKGELELLLQRPQPPEVSIDTSGRPSKGPADAPVTLVEFADFQCPHCKDASPVVDTLLQRYGDKLRVVYMDFPINASGISRRIAEGAECAGQQDRFWEYHDLAFQEQAQLKMDSAKELAAYLELDQEQFASCMVDPATAVAVERSKAEGERIGVDATPTFYVNGRRAVLDDLVGGLRAAIEAALNESSASGG